jgi:hypothetical protein
MRRQIRRSRMLKATEGRLDIHLQGLIYMHFSALLWWAECTQTGRKCGPDGSPS